MNISQLPTPFYVCYEEKLEKNLRLLREISEQSGAKFLLALKGFAFSQAMPLVSKYLAGCTCSGLWESQFAKKFFASGEICTYAPAFCEQDLDEILQNSSHIIANSLNEIKKIRKNPHFDPQKNSLGIRCNLEISFAPREIYNPCGRFSRLGIKASDFAKCDEKLDGLHFHALCEESFESFAAAFAVFEKNFLQPYLAKNELKWLNFGGGHHITKEGYEVKKLIAFLKDIKDKYNLNIFLEPGEAIGWQTGELCASVQDIVENEKKIAILDVSAEAHMPDTIIMPYTSEVRGAKILANRDELGEIPSKNFSYVLAANTCLAGDIMGEYEFEKELKIGDKIYFCDQIHYTIVKNTTFNGVKLPSLVFAKENGEIISKKDFSACDYWHRN